MDTYELVTEADPPLIILFPIEIQIKRDSVVMTYEKIWDLTSNLAVLFVSGSFNDNDSKITTLQNKKKRSCSTKKKAQPHHPREKKENETHNCNPSPSVPSGIKA